MATNNLETVRAYWAASAKLDYDTAGKCVAPDYVWIDHTKGIVARTAEELLNATAEDSVWSDRTFEITNVLETVDGALVVQATISGVLNGKWRSVEGSGERTRSESCTIFRFDDEGRISFEEHYSDALTVIEQVSGERRS